MAINLAVLRSGDLLVEWCHGFAQNRRPFDIREGLRMTMRIGKRSLTASSDEQLLVLLNVSNLVRSYANRKHPS